MAEAANDSILTPEFPGDSAPEEEIVEHHIEEIDRDTDPTDAFDVEPAGLTEKLPAIILTILALAWLGFAGWSAYLSLGSEGGGTPAQLANWIATACIPLALIGVIWLLLRRNSQREAMRFGRTSESMRAEARRLDSAIVSVSAQLAELRESVSAETDRLLALGEEAAGRLGSIGEEVRSASGMIEERSSLLDSAAKSAREDIEVLLSDLPRAERQARAVSAGLREAGVNAHEQTVSLDAQLTALSARGREADEVASGAARRLAAGLAQIEGVANASAARLDKTGEHIRAAVDESMKQSSAAVDDTRKAVDEIGTALAGMIADARISFEQSGEEASQRFATKVGIANEALDSLEARLIAQCKGADSLIANLDEGLSGTEAYLSTVNETGKAHLSALREAIALVDSEMDALDTKMGSNDEVACNLIARAAEIRAALDLSAESLSETLPQRLAAIEKQAGQTRSTLSEIGPALLALEESAQTVASYVETSSESIGDQRRRIEKFVEQFGERIATIRDAVDGFETALSETDERARSIADSAAPQLIETLLQVRETADQAAEKARAAFGDIIPQSAAALGEATRIAMTEAIGKNIQHRIAEINSASQSAIEAAHQAAEKLAEKMAEIEASTAAIDSRIAESQAKAEDADMDSFARQVTLLIESLNSTAIDVTKVLSNEVTDTTWAAYLKGDRGVFSRRAVRLLDAGEAREIASQYEFDAEFHDQVNRYIHDFEAMLRRVLGTRDGSPLAVTLLSSDNGKLYVALAQAIERFRE